MADSIIDPRCVRACAGMRARTKLPELFVNGVVFQENTMCGEMETGKMLLMKVMVLALVWAVSISWTASAGTLSFSLSADWSNTSDPNGPWSYNQGSVPLPLVPDWTPIGGCNQPAWAPSSNAGNFLPALMQANSCTANLLVAQSTAGNVKPGDILMHTVDPYNGTPALGVGNFLFKLPGGDNGEYEISGMVWDAGWAYGTARPQGWELLANGVEEASGLLSGIVPRSGAETFDVFANLIAGETVDLELYEAPGAAAGYFVGTNMSITEVSATPEPSTFALLGGALLVLGLSRARPAALRSFKTIRTPERNPAVGVPQFQFVGTGGTKH